MRQLAGRLHLNGNRYDESWNNVFVFRMQSSPQEESQFGARRLGNSNATHFPAPHFPAEKPVRYLRSSTPHAQHQTACSCHDSIPYKYPPTILSKSGTAQLIIQQKDFQYVGSTPPWPILFARHGRSTNRVALVHLWFDDTRYGSRSLVYVRSAL